MTMDIFLNIIAWIILTVLCTVYPADLESSRQRPKVKTPTVTYTIIAINVLIYAFMLLVTLFFNPLFYERVIQYWGCRPYNILNPTAADGLFTLIRAYCTLITYQFLHGGFFHILGNMYFLFIFGPGVEMGQNIRFRGRDRRPFNSFFPFLLFYLLCGIGSALCHILFFGISDEMMSQVVLVGASGSISGVLAAYLLGLWKDYNKIKIYVFYYIPILISVNFYLLYWILLQVSLFIVFGSKSSVSYVGHIGGFITGMFLWAFVCPWVELIVRTRPRGWFRKYRMNG